MLNRIQTSATRVIRHSEFLALVQRTGAKRRGTAYSPKTGWIIGYNFGTSIRPEVSPINVTAIGEETIESYLARGGRILKGATKTAKGVAKVHIKIATNAHNRTGSIVRRTVVPTGMRTSSLVSLAAAQRPYNGSAMKVFGPRG